MYIGRILYSFWMIHYKYFFFPISSFYVLLLNVKCSYFYCRKCLPMRMCLTIHFQFSGSFDILWRWKCNRMGLLCDSNFVCDWFHWLSEPHWDEIELAMASWSCFSDNVVVEFTLKRSKIPIFGHLCGDVFRCITDILEIFHCLHFVCDCFLFGVLCFVCWAGE